MENSDLENYESLISGNSGFYEQKRGLIAVWGKEAVQFLDGLISNDMKTLEDGAQMLASFPNAQGRLLAVVRVLRQGDRFLFETEEATREKVFQNLYRFTFAGDFFVEDLSDQYRYVEIWGEKGEPPGLAGGPEFSGNSNRGLFVPLPESEQFVRQISEAGAVEISDDLYETLRIEDGVPKYGVDMDETTIVPELGLDGMISYKKGCYIGQEIIARIFFRGHVAKRLTGLVLDVRPKAEERPVGSVPTDGIELTSRDGKNAGRITSITFSPKLGKTIAVAYVRYDYLAAGTELRAGETAAIVTDLPFTG